VTEALADPSPEPSGHARPGLVESLRGRSTLSATLVTAVAVGLLLYLVQWASPVLGPLFLGLFITALVAPLFGWLLDRAGSPTLALVVTVGVVLAVGGVIVLLAFASANQLADAIGSYGDQVVARYPELSSAMALLGVTVRMDGLIPPDAVPLVLRSVVGIVAEVASSLGFAVIIAALLLLDGRRLASLAGRGLGSENPVFREAPGVARAAVTYFGVRVRINAVTAVGLLVLMLLLGVDDALLWGIGAFFLSFVPYLGLTLALIPPAVLAFAESGAVAAAILVLGGIVLNLVAENVLEPAWTGRALSLATWLVFLMFFFCVWLLGPVGMLVSMPITVLLVLLLQGDERTRWLASLLTRDGSRPPHADEAPTAP
jgi:predicted PurR-regulated permease PerM